MNNTNDITIKTIYDVYFHTQNRWVRTNPTAREFAAIVLITDGEITYHFENVEFTVKKGDLVFIPSNICYTGRHEKNASYYAVDFMVENNKDFIEILHAPLVVKLSNFDTILSKFKKGVSVWEKQTNNYYLYAKSLIFRLMCEAFVTDVTNKTTTPTDDILDYIVDNIHEKELNVKKLSEMFYISVSQLRRNIFKKTGFTPNEYITKLRLNKAKHELTYTEKTIKTISNECGFASPYYFSRCFATQYGFSPTEFRKKNGNNG